MQQRRVAHGESRNRFKSDVENSVSAGKVALITGGTSGSDDATAWHMAELGVKVVVRGRLLVREVNRKGGCAASFRADLSPPDAPSALPELRSYGGRALARVQWYGSDFATPG